MSLSALEATHQACVDALADLKAKAFHEHVKLTLVARVPGDANAYVVVTADDLDEVIEVLRKEQG